MDTESFYFAVDTLKELIARPSFSREEQLAADFLRETWSRDGQQVSRYGNNLLIIPETFRYNKPTVLLNSHIDTVKVAEGWTRDPFSPDESPDGDADNGEIRLYGLGSNDAGASLVSLYAAFRRLSLAEQPCNFIFLASAEEEVSGSGGVESMLSRLPAIALGVVGEPTGMQPAIAERGLMVLDCEATGRAGHAARNEGINAIDIALADIQWLHSHRFPLVSPLLGEVKATATVIHAGEQHNVIPDRCRFTADVRSNGLYSNAELCRIIADRLRSSVTPRSLRLNASHINPEHPLIRRAELLGLQPFGSPTLSDQALMPFPTVKIGPGLSSRSHTADEYVRLSEIREAIEIYVRLLSGLIPDDSPC
ncbi:MAG: M20/M25/M40 family metallo-hydrolase [Tannerellaceae bacterium]|jgi:acetylornithine deacetylase|nr:M20/M25/M40 family metallo-hydrolase [Tannerellaceae bacterium]